MRKVLPPLFFTALGGGLVYFAFTYHIVWASEGLLLIPKQQASLADVYVDVRGWAAGEWSEHTLLARSLAKHGRSDLVIGGAANGVLQDAVDGFRGSWSGQE